LRQGRKEHERSSYTLDELLEIAMTETPQADSSINFLEHCCAIVAENAFHEASGCATHAELVVFPFELESIEILP